MRICAAEGCERAFIAKGFCAKHYYRFKKHGDPRGRRYVPPEERFWAKVEKTDTCWNWTAHTVLGYGQFRPHYPGKHVKAHRYSYALIKGEIAEGMALDHICHNKACVNPEHLREVTNKQNAENRSGLYSSNASGVNGVFWDTNRGAYRGGVRHNGVRYWVGYFSTLAEAEVAVVAKRNELFTHNDIDRKSA